MRLLDDETDGEFMALSYDDMDIMAAITLRLTLLTPNPNNIMTIIFILTLITYILTLITWL